jgi:RNA polymerase sigma factor (TIGR02999 family)
MQFSDDPITLIAMGEITQLLLQSRDGDTDARNRLFALLYAELRSLARAQLRRDSTLTLLDAPALVNEAFLRLTRSTDLPGQNRSMFLAYASTVMRSVIVDYVRGRGAAKRGGDQPPITLTNSMAGLGVDEPEVESLDRALRRLERIDERGHKVVEMRYFGGLGIEEVADVLGTSAATVKRDWQRARAFLYAELQAGREASP